MFRLLKSMLIVLVTLVVIGSAFAFYTYFLVDYSLESLETALAASDSLPEGDSQAVEHLYHNIVDDLVLNEVGSQKTDLKHLLITETASRSLDETLDRSGDKRAKIYLNEIIKRKKNSQPVMLRIRDSVKSQVKKIFDFLGSFFRFFGKKISRQDSLKSSSAEGVRFVFLSKTQKMEKDGRYKEVIERYRQYLKRYPGSSDRGFVSLSLSGALIRGGRLRESERLLKDIQNSYAGKIEARIASQMLMKISDLDKKSQKAEALLQLRSSGGDRNIEFELAALYISLYRFSDAEAILKHLAGQRDSLGIQSEFKLGWIYKKTGRLKESEQVFLNLLKSPGLPSEMELGINGELADIYYRLKNPGKALEYYKKLMEKSAETGADKAGDLWKLLSAFEQATIYHFDLKDSSNAKKYLAMSGIEFMNEKGGDDMDEAFFNVGGSDLRSQGFRALGSRQFGLAYELFLRNLVKSPDDAWTMAGLSTVMLLLGDLEEAEEYAKKSYTLQPDEYTCSMMGYIHGAKEEYVPAEAIYEKALKIKADYLPAQFNLACMQIRNKKYEKALAALTGMEKRMGLSSIMKAKIYNNLGYVQWQTGNRKEGLEKFKQAVALEPDYSIARKNIERIKLKNQDLVNEDASLEPKV